MALTSRSLYAAYGGNLDPLEMASRAPNSTLLGSGWLNGWRLTFGGAELSWQGPLPTVVEQPGSQVFVMLYALDPIDERDLDSAEGFDLGAYQKVHVRVSTLAQDENAWVYVVRGYEGGQPTRAVRDRIVEAATAADAPADYLHTLRTWPTSD